MLKPLMQLVLDEELKIHPEKNKEKEEKAAELGQDLLEKLWIPEEKPNTFLGKVKSVLSDGVNLPQILFNRMIDFRARQGLTQKKEQMQRAMFYTTKAFREGTEIMSAACYLFHHNPHAFERYATNQVDFQEDLRRSTYDEESIFMPFLGTGVPTIVNQSEQEENYADDRRLPLLSFAPIKYGLHPCLINSSREIEKYKQIFLEPSLYGFKNNPYRFEPLKKLLYFEQPESNYPATHHTALVIAVNEFNKRLECEPVKVCSHKENQASPKKQKTL